MSPLSISASVFQTTSRNALQLLNASFEMLVRVEGISMDWKALQYPKAKLGRVSSPPPITAFVMALQLPNAHSPMLVTLSGMLTVESLVYLNA